MELQHKTKTKTTIFGLHAKIVISRPHPWRQISIQTSWVTLCDVSYMTSRFIFAGSRRNDVVTSQVADTTNEVLLWWNCLYQQYTHIYSFHSGLTSCLKRKQLEIICCLSITRLQWSSGNVPDCGVTGPRFESDRGQLQAFHKNHYDIQPWARALHLYCSA